jgi:hypothetical protein
LWAGIRWVEENDGGSKSTRKKEMPIANLRTMNSGDTLPSWPGRLLPIDAYEVS